MMIFCFFFFFKQKTAYEMRISDWSSDVCSSDLLGRAVIHAVAEAELGQQHLGAAAPLAARQAGIDCRHLHIGGGAFTRQQVVLLEDEPEGLAAQQGAGIGPTCRDLGAIAAVTARSRPVEQAGKEDGTEAGQ